ncbi:RNA polymerase sigma-70 factor [Carboxylicivirga sp. M1479]|uniref:RNA polymerase sigma-70 factor n=1 Tax=Carboxylicivirga sp. M1479 TaxID=2594476 RepID=UPI001177AB05|nr:RNA polymerase sigma-70 factor [Carboxylicivirga sp. M1479]TRX71473.1 RNA polymerase sigma-70 factor [Carboxylicivirga sp. M1479]
MDQITELQVNSGNIEKREEVYEYLFSTYYSRLCAYALRYVERKDIVEDIVSDTFYKMWQRGDIQITSSLQGYLFQAVYNNCMYFLRQQSSELKRDTIIQDQFEDENNIRILDDFYERDSLIVQELDEAIKAAVDKLPEQAKRIFTLKRYQGLKNKEVAELLDVSVKTVEMHMTRSLSFLRSELDEYCPVLVSIILSTFL